MEKEEILWWQRSRISWLKEGDRNTKFFHACASQRKKTNAIQSVRDSNGEWHTDQAGISQVAVGYFTQLFSTSSPATVDEVVSLVEQKVSPDMNDAMLAPFMVEELQQLFFK